MLRYFIRRLVLMIPILLAVMLIIFLIMKLTPGDPALIILGEGASAEAYEAVREELGLNDPIPVQFFNYLIRALQGDFGSSYKNSKPVLNEIASRLPTTLKLALITTLMTIIFGITLGILTALKQYSVFDITAVSLALIITAVPSFFAAILLIILFTLKLKWLPMVGLTTIKHYIMPSIALSSSYIAGMLRMTRSSMLEVMRQDYVRTAKAKGANKTQRVIHHQLRNALLPSVTILGIEFGQIVGGAIIVEQVFAIPGLGSLLISAVQGKDMPVVMGCVLFSSVAVSVGALLTDLAYTIIDPRLITHFSLTRRRKKVEYE